MPHYSSEYGYTDRMTTGNIRTVAIAVAIAAALALSGCRCRTKTGAVGGSLPAATQATKVAATEVRGAADTIANANTRIEAAAPALQSETSVIASGVQRLAVVAGSLDQTGATLADASLKAATLEADLTKARARIAELEDASNGLLTRLLAGAAVAGLALAAVSLVWLRSGNGVIAGIAIFGVAVAGQWVVEYRVLIGVASLVAAGAWAAWTVIRERSAAKQVVATVEAIKARVPDFADVANAIQSRGTKRLVDAIQRSIGAKR